MTEEQLVVYRQMFEELKVARMLVNDVNEDVSDTYPYTRELTAALEYLDDIVSSMNEDIKENEWSLSVGLPATCGVKLP